MSALVNQWRQWSAKFAALTRRERAIVAAAAIFGGGFLIFNFGIEPLLLKSSRAAHAESAAHTELVQQQAHLLGLKAQNSDPDAANKQRLAQARQKMVAIGERLAAFEAGMVPPARMQEFLRGLLAKNRAIELLSLKTLPVTLVGAAMPGQKSQAAAATPAPAGVEPGKEGAAPDVPSASGEGIYQHGIELRMAGSYNDLLNYLAELERMPQRLMWNSVSLTVEKYPRNIMVLRVYTLSLDRSWLTV